MAEIETDTPQLRARLPREVQSSFYVIVFIGLTLAFTGGVSLFFLTPVFQAEFSSALPSLALFSLVMAICALIVRKSAGFLATKKGGLVLLAICFACGCLGPLGLLFSGSVWWVLCASAVGCLCIMYEWWSHLCSLEHRMLVLFVSSALLVGSAIVLLLAFLGVRGSVGSIIVSVFLLVSTVFLCFLEDGSLAALYSVDPSESPNRVRSLSMRRLGEFSYFAIGLMTAVVIELVVFMVPVDLANFANAPAIMFAIAVVLIFAICFFGHWRADFDLEGHSKDYLAFTCAIGFLPLPFTSGLPLFILLVYLLFIVGLQLTFVIIAIIELARFEEISPLWYLGEAAFLFVGMCVGSAMAKICLLELPENEAVVIICVASIIFITFAQVFFNKFSYPEIELFRSDENESSARITQKSLSESEGIDDANLTGLADGVLQNSDAEKTVDVEDIGGDKTQNEDKSEGETETEAEKLKGSMRFRKRIAEIAEVYKLSPRQREILELLAKGRNAGYIMEHFHISRSTVKTHVYNIYIKLEIHSRQELLDLIESDEDLVRPEYLQY